MRCCSSSPSLSKLTAHSIWHTHQQFSHYYKSLLFKRWKPVPQSPHPNRYQLLTSFSPRHLWITLTKTLLKQKSQTFYINIYLSVSCFFNGCIVLTPTKIWGMPAYSIPTTAIRALWVTNNLHNSKKEVVIFIPSLQMRKMRQSKLAQGHSVYIHTTQSVSHHFHGHLAISYFSYYTVLCWTSLCTEITSGGQDS